MPVFLKILQNEFGVAMTKEIEEGVREMCTFAEALERAEARAEARARDEAKAARAEAKVARAEIETNRLETIKSIMSNFKVTIDRAMAVAGVLMTSAMSTGKSWLWPESAAETCFSLA